MYATLFGLLAATGLRISEALAMRLEDVTEDGLIIRQTKFHKSRLVPVHPTTQQALDIYRNVREQLPTPDDALFVSLWGKRLAYVTVDAIFLRLARSIGLRGEPGQRGARMHDLRHNSEAPIIPSGAWRMQVPDDCCWLVGRHNHRLFRKARS
jgi:integrase